MSAALTAMPSLDPDLTALEQVVVQGDLSRLSPEDRWSYYVETCRSLKLNPMTRPFEYITLSGRLTLYARKDCTDQLRRIHNVSLDIVSQERLDDLYVVTAHAMLPSGRHDEEVGVVTLGGLKGDALANALMRCVTKAKRRVTLSICGLGLLDETEVSTIPDARYEDADALHGKGEPSREETLRAEQMTAEAPPRWDRADAEYRYQLLAERAITAEHPKAEKIRDTPAAALSDGVLRASIQSLEGFLAEAEAF